MRISDWSSDVWTAEVGLDRVQTGMCDNRCGCLERLAAAASQHTQVRTSTTDALAREGGQMLRSEEHTSELQSLMRISYAVFCLKKKNTHMNSCAQRTRA